MSASILPSLQGRGTLRQGRTPLTILVIPDVRLSRKTAGFPFGKTNSPGSTYPLGTRLALDPGQLDFLIKSEI